MVERLVGEAREPRNHGYPTSAGCSSCARRSPPGTSVATASSLDAATQTLVTWGASEALAHLPWVLLGPGDTALVPEPCYPIHRYAVRFSGAERCRSMWACRDGRASASGRRRRPRPRAPRSSGPGARPPASRASLLVSFPHNPTTRCVELADFERLVAFARARDLVVVHDFAYADIAFDGYRPPSILQVPGAADVAVELVSLSKSHNMAGWRLGLRRRQRRGRRRPARASRATSTTASRWPSS